MKYLFFFGNTPDLSFAELSALVPNTIKIDRIALECALLETEEDSLFKKLSERLGGTVKIATLVTSLDSLDNVAGEVVSNLSGEAKVTFGFSLYGDKKEVKQLFPLTKRTKEALEDVGIKARFVLAKAPHSDLSSVVVSKQKVAEFCLVSSDTKIYLSKTIWVQPFEDWSKRDYGRPQAEGHIGMLPPKVARIMINLAVGENDTNGKLLLDPFCGVGTILSEALTCGLNVIGVDNDSKQVNRSRENVAWLINELGIQGKHELIVNSADRITQNITKPVDFIVSETDLGPSNHNFLNSNIDKVSMHLIDLLVSCLNTWKGILVPNGKIVIAVPSYMIRGVENRKIVSAFIDKASVMGYSQIAGPYQYFRPQAVVKRNIIILQKN